MDEGIAAVLAGVAGLVGAAIGGIVTARGARIGAEKTAEAAIEQARVQEQAQRQHWLRDERKRAATDLLVVYDRFAVAATRVTLMLGREIDASSNVWTDYVVACNDFRVAYSPVRLLGPHRVHEVARELLEMIETHHDGIREWVDGVVAASEDARTVWREREKRQVRAMGQLHGRLVDTVSDALQHG